MAKLIQGGGEEQAPKNPTKLVVDENNLVFSPVPGQTLESMDYTPEAGELNRLGVSLMPDYDFGSVNQKLALEQPASEQAVNMVKGGSKQFLAGFLDNFNYDIPDMVALVQGKEQEYGNWLSDFTEELRESAEENPIYQDGASFSDPAYWMNQGKNLAFSVGLATGAMTEQAALSAITGATFGTGGALQGTVLAAKMAKLGRMGKGVAGNVLFGTGKGIHEGYINALETYKGTYDKFIDLGFNEADATKRAGQAAALGYKLEVGPLMALNALQFGTIGKYNPFKGKSVNLGYSGAMENITSKIFPGVKNKFAKGALDMSLNAGSESIEEMIQTGVSKYAQYETVADAGYAFADLEIFDQEMTDSMVGGFLGGLVFGTMGKVVDRINKSKDKGAYGKQHDEFIAKVKQKSMEDLKLLSGAFQEGNKRKVDFLKYKMAKQGAVNAIFLDMANGKETAFESYIGGMQDILDAANSGDAEQLKTYGIETQEDLENIKTTYPKLIQDTEQLKQNFVKAHEKTGDVYASLNLADAQQARNHAATSIRENTQNVNTILNGDPLFENLSADAKQYIHLNAKKKALGIKRFQEGTATSGSVAGVGMTENFKKELAEIDEQLANLDISQKDKALADTYDTDEAVSLLYTNMEMEDVIAKANEKIKYWNNTKNIQKENKQRAESKINRAKTEKEVTEAEAELKKNGQVTPQTQEKINSKKQEARVKEKVSKKEETTPNPKTKSTAQKIAKAAEKATAEVVAQDSMEDDFQPISVEDVTPEVKATLKSEMKNYYNNLKADIAEPTFEDMILDFIQNEGKENTDRLFNLLDQAWQDNGYKKANAKTIYDKYFKDRKSISSRMVSLVEEDPTTVVEENNKIIKKSKEAKAKPVRLDNNNQPNLKDGTSFKTSSPDLKLAHLSIPYARTIQENEDGSKSVIDEDISDELNQSQKINSMKLLNPDLFNPGTQIQIRIPENVDTYYVTHWEDAITKGESMTFGEWMKKTGVEKGSEEWLAKVPMVVSDGTDDVAYIHDVEWYNPINIGMKDTPQEQGEVIMEARANLMNVRREVIENGAANMVISEKRAGTFQTYKEPVSLQEANPEAQIAIAGQDGRLYLNGDSNKPFDTDNLLFTDQKFIPGYVYDIRRGTVKGEYTALRIDKGTLNQGTQDTVKWLIKSYLLNRNTTGQFETLSAQARSVAKQTLDTTGLDPKDMKDLGELLNAHVRLMNLSGVQNLSNPDSIQQYLEKSPELKNGEPFIAMEKGRIIIGTKGGKVSYLHPDSVNDASKVKAIPAFFSILDSVMKSGFRNNISKNFLTDGRTMPVFDDKGQQVSTKSYETQAREGLMTNVRSYNVGTEESPVYATVIQPVLKFQPSNQEFSDFVDTGKVSQQTIERIANKIMKGQQLTAKEEAMRQTAFEEVEAILTANAPVEVTVTEKTDSSLSMEDIQTLKAAKEFLVQKGLPLTHPDILAIDEKLGLDRDEDLQPAPLTEEQVMQMREDLSGVEGISILQDYLITDYLFNEISSTVGNQYGGQITEAELLKEFNGAYDVLIAPKRIQNEKVLANLKAMKIEGLQGVVDRMELEMEVFQVLEDNWSSFAEKALEKYKKYDVLDEVDENYSRESFEKNKQDAVSSLMKKFLRNVKQVDANGQVAKGFLGIPLYVSFDTVDSTIRSVLASPIETDVDFDTMVLRLDQNKKNQKWLPQVIERLKVAPQQVKNQFVYNYQGHSLSMKFLMYSENRNGGHTLKVYDTNSNEVTRSIRQAWTTNLKGDAGANILAIQEGRYIVNKDRARVLSEQFNNFNEEIQAGTPVDNEVLRTWLKNFGIELSDETLNELKSSPMQIVTKDKKENLPFNMLFRKSKNSSGLFGKLAAYLEEVQKTEGALEVDENDKNHPFSDMSGILNTLSRIESKYAKYATVHSFRDGDKNIFAYTNSKHGTDVVNKLKFNEEFREQLNEKPFNSPSLLLKMLGENEAIREKFSIDHVGITSNKEMGSKPFGDNSITKASPTDHEHVKLGMFQDTKQGEIKYQLGENKSIETRLARMFLPTMSDKSQMLDILTPVLDLREKNFNEDKTFNDQVLDVAFSQLVTPEVNRISSFQNTNVKGYDIGAPMFLMVPAMNSLMYNGERVIQLMATNPEQYNADWFQKNMGAEAKNVLRDFLQTAINNKVAEWKEIGVVEGTADTVSKIKLLDSTYMDRFKSDMTTNVNMAAADYVINSMITNANIFMTMAGDPAIYAKGDMKQYFQNGDIFLPKTEHGEAAYSKMAKDALGVNIGKRLALMLTPGNKLANSKGKSYMQLFIEDPVDMTPNILALAELFYDNIDSLRDGLNTLNAETKPANRAEMIKVLKNAYPKIADYFEIELADAQEYTTVKEHIDVLWGKGEIDDKTYADINAKLDRQYAAEEKGEAIDPKDFLSRRELSFVLQPVKPVYTGFINDKENNMMRMMYIKSSSFALIPQLTKGTELDKLRITMEKLQKTEGKNVRASYQSANKVGALSKPIKAFNQNGTYNNAITPEVARDSTLILDRENFKIQQEVPFKTGAKKEERNRLGTQPMKLLFGDGMLNLVDKGIFNQYNEAFNNILMNRRKALHERLGVDDNGMPLDKAETADRLQRMLIEEAKKRNYPKQDIEALKLEPVYDENNNIIDISFSLPLWLSPNSNKYESLLNSVVTNQLVDLKMPGSSYVVGSEAGFKMQAELEGINQNNIVFTDKWEGQLKPAEIVDGELKKAQVLVSPKFRDGKGNVIKLINEDGTPNPYYTKRGEDGVLRLKKDMISEELMNFTTYRIPTSGHVSMSQVEIVGFLPEEAGDLMIMPMNFITQMGQDFDVDKQYSVNLNTYMDEDGRLRAYDEAAMEKDLEGLTKAVGQNKAIDSLFGNLFGDTLSEDFTEGSIPVEERLAKMRMKLQERLYENQIVDAFGKVLSDPNPEVQKKIQQVLSMDFAKSQATIISEQIAVQTKDNNFSFLSDTYQKEKMELGASGKTGIGVYSNYVTFHSLSNQAQQTKQPRLQIRTEEGYQDYRLTIGKFTASGVLGNENTLDGNRSVAEVFAERQNTATDNEKEQIMGRVNVNDATINVDSLLTALGFDQDIVEVNGKNTPMSIPYLLLSQPIIREYVRLKAIKESNVAGYNPNLQEEVVKEITQKFDNAEAVDSSLLTGQALFNSLANPSNSVQTAVLDVFLEVEKMARQVQQLQTMLSINRGGLGKSFFETIEKHDQLGNIKISKSGIVRHKNFPGFMNIDAYIGEIKNVNSQEAKEEAIADGFRIAKDVAIKPETPVGRMLVEAVVTGYNLWSGYFPYDNAAVKVATDDIIDLITSEETSDRKKTELRMEIFKEMKKYFVSSTKLGAFEQNPQQERYRLYFDNLDEGKISLANYLRQLKDTPEFKELVTNNKLMSRFQFDINQDGHPSLIKFDNSRGENFDEEYMYTALIELIDSNQTLPQFNGEDYSTQRLAQDLVAYAYLEGGVQEAVQFTKYIPVSLLNAIGFGNTVRLWSSNGGRHFTSMLKNQENEIGRFTLQYFRNNPQRLPKVTEADINSQTSDFGNQSKILSNLNAFRLTEEAADNVESGLIAIYNPKLPKGEHKFQIYMRDGQGVFNRIPAAGIFGMSEYSIKDSNPKSLIYGETFIAEAPAKPVEKKGISGAADTFNVLGEDLQATVSNIARSTSQQANLAAAVMVVLDPNTKLEVIDDASKKFRGRFSRKNNVISINKAYLAEATAEEIANTIMHETIHSLTANYVQNYVHNNGQNKVENIPASIQNLTILFSEVEKTLGKETLDQLREKVGKDPLTNEELKVGYGGYNIHEMMTLALTEPEFQKAMAAVEYKSSGKTLLEKFQEILDTMLKTILGDAYKANSLTPNIIATTMQIINEQAEWKGIINSDKAAEALINNPIFKGKGKPDVIEQDNPFDVDDSESFDLSIFANPFKC